MLQSALRQGSILAVMDLSSVGRCSALAVVPVLSLSGFSCALLPTAYLSTHTGGFGEVHRRDMSEDMKPALAHFISLGLRFDAVYIGYVASAGQLSMMEEALPRLLMPGGRLFVDPVMGDGGKRYSFAGMSCSPVSAPSAPRRMSSSPTAPRQPCSWGSRSPRARSRRCQTQRA